MTSRTSFALVLLLLVAAGCGHDERPAPAATTPSGPPASEAYNAAQLTQALLTDIPGYEMSGAPQSGQYGTLTAVRNSLQMQQAAKLDKPQCASSTRAVSSEKAVWSVPSALVAFVKGRDQTVSETLMAVGPDVAAQQVGLRVPPRAATSASPSAGAGRPARSWTAAAHDRRGIPDRRRLDDLRNDIGPDVVRRTALARIPRHDHAVRSGATRDEAERLAQQAYQQAERILP